MPFYRYECENCGHEFRVLHLEGVNDDVTCPSCDSIDIRRLLSRVSVQFDIRRLLSRVSVQFKGSGYYKTDRANKKSKAGSKRLSDKDSSTESDSKASKETKESKPDKPSKSSDNE